MVLRYTIGKDTGTGSRIDDQTNAAELANRYPFFVFAPCLKGGQQPGSKTYRRHLTCPPQQGRAADSRDGCIGYFLPRMTVLLHQSVARLAPSAVCLSRIPPPKWDGALRFGGASHCPTRSYRRPQI